MCLLYIYQAQNRKGCLTAPLSVTGGHILIHIGKSFSILYNWVYMKKFNDDWWITSVPAMRLQKWRISLNREFFANLCMKTIIFVINSCTKFKDQLIKGTDVVEPQSCRKSRNFRLTELHRSRDIIYCQI